MKLVGNIKEITPQRSSKNQKIELHIDRIEYLTSKKDGRYYQDFNYVDDLESPLIITGDCLARSTEKKLDEGEYEFKVYDLVEGEYVLNENKYLGLTLIYDFDENQTILSEVDYTVTVSLEEFEKIKKDRELYKTQKPKHRKKK